MGDPRRVVSCLKCGGTWTGLRRCHCGSCHENFSSVTAFDRHRVDFACKAPASRGLVLVAGYWSMPGNMPKTAVFGRRQSGIPQVGSAASTDDGEVAAVAS